MRMMRETIEGSAPAREPKSLETRAGTRFGRERCQGSTVFSGLGPSMDGSMGQGGGGLFGKGGRGMEGHTGNTTGRYW